MLLKRALPCSNAQGRQKQAEEEMHRKSRRKQSQAHGDSMPWQPQDFSSSTLHRWPSVVSMFRCPTAHFAIFRAIFMLLLLPPVIMEEQVGQQ